MSRIESCQGQRGLAGEQHARIICKTSLCSVTGINLRPSMTRSTSSTLSEDGRGMLNIEWKNGDAYASKALTQLKCTRSGI